MKNFKIIINKILLVVIIPGLFITNASPASAQRSYYCSINEIKQIETTITSLGIDISVIKEIPELSVSISVIVSPRNGNRPVYQNNGLSQSAFPITLNNLIVNHSYDVYMTIRCTTGGSDMTESYKTAVVTTLAYLDDQITPDEESVVSTTPVIDNIVVPPIDPLDCDGSAAWSNPSAGPRSNSKVCPPLNLGPTNQAKGGKQRGDSKFHIYGTFSADDIVVRNKLSSQNLMTPAGTFMKICSNSLGKIVICANTTSIKPAKLSQAIRYNGSDWIGTERFLVEPDVSGNIFVGNDFKGVSANDQFISRIALVVNGALQIKGSNYGNSGAGSLLVDQGAGVAGWKSHAELQESAFTLIGTYYNQWDLSEVRLQCPARYPIVFSGGGLCYGAKAQWNDSSIGTYGAAGDIGSRIITNGFSGAATGSSENYRDNATYTPINNGGVYKFKCSQPGLMAYAVCMKK